MKKRYFTTLLFAAVILGSGIAAAAQETETGEIIAEVLPVSDAESEAEEFEVTALDESMDAVQDFGAAIDTEEIFSEQGQTVEAADGEIIIEDILTDAGSAAEVEAETEPEFESKSESEVETEEGISIDLLETEVEAEPMETRANAFSGSGDGTKTNPYRITTAQQLDEVRYNLNACYILENDIDLSGYANWAPITDTEYSAYDGVFDGNNKTISGLHISQSSLDMIGLFGAYFGTIKNINLKDADIRIKISSGDSDVFIGAVAGQVYAIENCTVSGTVSVSGDRDTAYGREVDVGGVVGRGNAENCVNKAEIYVTDVDKTACGGVSGATSHMGGDLSLGCDNYGNVSVTAFGPYAACGGIYGRMSTTDLTKCRNYGKIYGETQNVNADWETPPEEGCYAGGVVGKIDLIRMQFTKSANYGDVESHAQNGGRSFAGGIVGCSEDVWGYNNNNKIRSCFNICNSVRAEGKDRGGSVSAEKSSAARITNYCSAVAVEACYSLSTTLCNGSVPTVDIGPNQLNGGSLSMDEISALMNGSGDAPAGNETVLRTYPKNGEVDVDPEADGEGYNLIVEFDGVVKANEGSVRVIDLDTGNTQNYGVGSVEIDHTRITIPGVRLEYGKKYSVQFDNACISIDGVSFSGFSNENDWVFQTAAETHTEHSWDSGTVTKEAGCTESGIRTYTCTICGETKTEEIPAVGHTYGSWKVTREATVSKTGMKTKTCKTCGAVKKQTIAKLKAAAKLNVSKITLKVKQSTTGIEVTGLAKGDSIKSWKSSNPKIAVVTKNGKITAKNKTGKATVTVTLASGLKKKITVTVQKKAVAVKKITGVSQKLTLKKGKKTTLKPVLDPITAEGKITYKSSNVKVASVTGKGVIKAKKKGTATITVRCGKKSVKCKVTVK